MATNVERSKYETSVLAFINNIPHQYHSSDLRDYFSELVESNGFICFHFRHRPEVRKLKSISENNQCSLSEIQQIEIDSHVPQNTAGVRTQIIPQVDVQTDMDNKKKETSFGIAKLSAENYHKFVKMYHRKRWLNRQGNSMTKVCVITKYLEKELHSSAVNIEESLELPQNHNDVSVHQNNTNNLELNYDTHAEISKLAELNPPSVMPQGNVGTPTATFLSLINKCLLPPSIIKKLGLKFKKNTSKKIYSMVPLVYDGSVYQSHARETNTVLSANGNEIEPEQLATRESSELKGAKPNVLTKKEQRAFEKHSFRKLKDEKIEENMIHIDSSSEEDAGDCEEWERHESTHNDPFKLQPKERLFEDDMEVVWEKGGSGLVFYTDAQYWDKLEGDFDEQTTDDWDLDYSAYYDKDGGDMDARDYIKLRKDQRRRAGINDDDDDARIGSFDRYSKGIGRKVMAQQGWTEGQSLGSSQTGLVDALGNDGQKPSDKRGLGYRGEKLIRYGTSSKKPRCETIISTVFDNPKETDPMEPLLRRHDSTKLKWRDTHKPGKH